MLVLHRRCTRVTPRVVGCISSITVLEDTSKRAFSAENSDPTGRPACIEGGDHGCPKLNWAPQNAFRTLLGCQRSLGSQFRSLGCNTDMLLPGMSERVRTFPASSSLEAHTSRLLHYLVISQGAWLHGPELWPQGMPGSTPLSSCL